ncbi:MAG: RsmE family RNA methyltransferase [Spirochaetales bacterium]|nr:RsmE family RNA methyltransferase [Spirochaetales bacterium]
MKQFICNQQLTPGETVTLTGEEFHYLCRVRRMQSGDSLELSDSDSTRFTGTLTAIREEECDLLVKEELLFNQRDYAIHLYLCLCKGKKQDLMIRQAVEAGVSSITLLNSRYSQVKLSGNEKSKFDRWQKIIKEARQQSGSSVNTGLRELISFDELPDAGEDSMGLFCHQEKLAASPLSEMKTRKIREIHLIIGSEGGLADSEIEIMKKKGYSSLFLGHNVLRAETASIFALGTIISSMELS